MKKLSIILIGIVCLVMTSCKKYELPDNKFEYTLDEISVSSGMAVIEGDYSYGGSLTKVDVLYANNKDLNNAKTVEAVVIDKHFRAFLIGLEFQTQYYYAIEFYNEIGSFRTEVKSFTSLGTTGTVDGYEYVDLGLPSGLKWATCNVGATSPEEYGNYYAWGEISPKSEYNQETYTVNDVILDISAIKHYDAATANWGMRWRMPNDNEMRELMEFCTWTWTQQEGVNGYEVTGPNGYSIFMPAAGSYNGTMHEYDNKYGLYWCSIRYDNLISACRLQFYEGYQNLNWASCYIGRTIRAVLKEQLNIIYPMVETSNITDITGNSAKCGGDVLYSGNGSVLERGVCWSTSQNPTINDKHTMDGAGVGPFTSNITGLTMNTTYYVRAYAINEMGISYGEQKSFKTNECKYVDLGLPSGLKWAYCNVGATSPEEYGDYFAWGEISPKSEYTRENCVMYGNTDVLEYSGNPQYDAATANWGTEWRTPEYQEFRELVNECTWTWQTQDGVSGYKVTGPNGNYIFLPAAGIMDGTTHDSPGTYGGYWISAALGSGNAKHNLAFYETLRHLNNRLCFFGLTIRPVTE